MSAHGFKSLFMVTSVAGAALGCYLVSLNVASERAKLERVEGKIVLAQREIRLLQTEIGTRGRLAQLERWNASFIRLSAPTADQFLEGGFQLATMVKPAPKPVIEAPIVLASAPTEHGVTRQPSTSDGDEATTGAASRPSAPSAQDMMRVASYERPVRSTSLAPVRPTTIAPSKPAKAVATKPILPKAAAAKGIKVAPSDALSHLPATSSGGASATALALEGTKETGTPR